MPLAGRNLSRTAALACAITLLQMLEPLVVLGEGGAPPQLGLHDEGACAAAAEDSRALQQEAAVRGLLARVLPEHAHLFTVSVHLKPGGGPGSGLNRRSEPAAAAAASPATWFRACCDGKRIHLDASSGVEAATGLHWLLKERCGSSVSWAATGGARIPGEYFSPEGLLRLQAQGPLARTREVPLQYYQNAVTSSYSMAWWGWERWEAEIDWMALQGINLPLAFAGQEAIWARVFAGYGIPAEDLEDFFAGPAFQAWQRMGNVQGWGGPLPAGFMERQAELQKRIVARMRAFGMAPVLPAFAGFVPAAFVRKFPAASFTRASRWGGFPDEYCCPAMLHPLDPLFQELGAAFIREQRAAYGWEAEGQPSYYAADCFNEMRPGSAGPAYLASISSAVYQAMAAADPSARWLMQAWLFFSDPAFWGQDQIRALLGGVPAGRLVLLDLFAEAHPQWSRTDSFGGVPFIWCMLHNFGGSPDMYGALPAAVEGFRRALDSGSSVVGLGVAPEGIEQNPVVYDLVNELAFRSEPPALAAWFEDYARRRYGQEAPPEALQAWQLLRQSVYDCHDGHANTVMDIPISRPGMSRPEIGLWGLHPHLWYDPAAPLAAWRLLAGSGGGELGTLPGFRYDLVDVGRNVLSKHSTQLWWAMVCGYYERDAARVVRAGEALLGLLCDMDALLATHPGFMLGPRVAEARAAGATPAESDLHERNLRAQLTHWGTSPGSLGDSEIHDYASKQWAGLVGGYYRERWAQWLDWLLAELEAGREYDAAGWRNQTVRHTLAWAQEVRTPFPLEPQGDPVALSLALLAKYFGTEEEAGAAAARALQAATEAGASGGGGGPGLALGSGCVIREAGNA